MQYLGSNRKANLRLCSELGWEPGPVAPPAAGQEGLSRVLIASNFDFSNPDSLAYRAVLENITDDPTQILRFGTAIAGQQNKQSSAKVGTSL